MAGIVAKKEEHPCATFNKLQTMVGELCVGDRREELRVVFLGTFKCIPKREDKRCKLCGFTHWILAVLIVASLCGVGLGQSQSPLERTAPPTQAQEISNEPRSGAGAGCASSRIKQQNRISQHPRKWRYPYKATDSKKRS